MELASFALLLLTSLYVCECYPQPTPDRDVQSSLHGVEGISETELEQEPLKLQLEGAYSSISSGTETRRKRRVSNNCKMPITAYIGRDNRLHVSLGDSMIVMDSDCNPADFVPNGPIMNNFLCRMPCEYDGTKYKKVIYCRDTDDANSTFVAIPIANRY